MGVAIEVKELNAWFGKAQVLKEINIKVGANLVTAVIGPSGCGKSTFIRCLNRMHETIPEARLSGSVQVGEIDVYERPGCGGRSPAHRHGLPEAEPVSHHVDLRQRRRRAAAERLQQAA